MCLKITFVKCDLKNGVIKKILIKFVHFKYIFNQIVGHFSILFNQYILLSLFLFITLYNIGLYHNFPNFLFASKSLFLFLGLDTYSHTIHIVTLIHTLKQNMALCNNFYHLTKKDKDR